MSGQWGFRQESQHQTDGSGGQQNTAPYPACNLEEFPQQSTPETHIPRNVELTSFQQIQQHKSPSETQNIRDAEYKVSRRGGNGNDHFHNRSSTGSQVNNQMPVQSSYRGDGICEQYQSHESPTFTSVNSSNKQEKHRDLSSNPNAPFLTSHNPLIAVGFPTEPTVPVVSQRSELDILQERMREENERADREHEERMRKRREERAQKRELLEKNVSNEMKQNELNEQRRVRETQKKLEEERKKLEQELLKDTTQKEEKYQKEMENLEKRGEQELEEMKKQRQREKLIHEKIVNDKDEEFLKNTLGLQKEAEAMNDELSRLQAEHNERIGQIYIELEKEREEMQRKNRIRMDQMKQQWEQIKLMLQFKIWNEVIEKNWVNRLNALRSSTKKIVELFNRFYNNAREMRRHIGNSELFIKEKQKCIPMLNALIETITPEIDMLTEESENLNIQWNNTGKRFVFCIKESVEKLTYACRQFENALKCYLDCLEKNDCASFEEHSHHLKLVKKSYDDLSKYSNEIPTLAELKRNNSDEMQQEYSANTHHQDVMPTQSVIIEEIE